MTVSITLTDLVIRQIILDYDLARVHIVYDRVDADTALTAKFLT